jgi:hypothetical protein
LAYNNIVWMGRAGRHATWDEVEANGPRYEELNIPDIAAAYEESLIGSTSS